MLNVWMLNIWCCNCVWCCNIMQHICDPAEVVRCAGHGVQLQSAAWNVPIRLDPLQGLAANLTYTDQRCKWIYDKVSVSQSPRVWLLNLDRRKYWPFGLVCWQDRCGSVASTCDLPERMRMEVSCSIVDSTLALNYLRCRNHCLPTSCLQG